jgi:hypothetical protein
LGQAVLPVAGGIAFFVALGLVLWGVAALVSRGGDVRVRLGDDVFQAGAADRLAEEIASSGPLLFPGLIGPSGAKAIGVYHTGAAPEQGWSVYALVPPGAATTCVVELDRQARVLVDPCSGQRYPADGTGLEPVPWTVDGDGRLVIDLTPAGDPGRGTSTTS